MSNELMPPLPASRLAAYESYKLAWLPDGFPGRQTDDGVRPHPTYGTDVIQDYLGLYMRTRETRYLDAARKVADAAIARMDDLEGALVFRVHPGSGVTPVPGSYYSGLTQGRYLEVT